MIIVIVARPGCKSDKRPEAASTPSKAKFVLLLVLKSSKPPYKKNTVLIFFS